MLAFLEETILSLQEKYDDLSECVLILPSKRAGGFLKNYLLKHASKTTFAPKIISIEEFIEELSGLRITQPDELLIKSYEAYLLTHPIREKESFEEFASWANALLNDFSEIDRYLVNPKTFFDYLSSIKTLEKWGVKNETTPFIDNYLEFWNHLFQFYTQLNYLLANEQLGYQGMVYRKAAEDIEHYIKLHGTKAHIFIGFNALNTAEQQIIQELLETGNTDVFWDTDQFFYSDEKHSASRFIRSYVKNWKYYQNHPLKDLATNYEQPKEIKIVALQNNIGQAKYLGTLLKNYTQEKLDKTAIVLADEALLVPVLYSLPPNVKQANVTMGLSLQAFPATGFFESLLRLHLKPTTRLYFKSVFELLNHPLSQNLIVKPEAIVMQISEQNRTFIDKEQLIHLGGTANTEILSILFGDWNNIGSNALSNCQKLLQKLQANDTIGDIQRLVWKKLEEVFQRMSSWVDHYDYLNEVSTIYSLFTQLASSVSLDFAGDAYSGLQIMGVLETRGLDFENIIMLSVNEGTLPAGKSNASFITYDLKKEYGLPLYTDKDAVYTYHFYRLLHRASEITLLYNSFTQGLNSGEKSRYLLQLEFERPESHELRFEAVSGSVAIQQNELKHISKTEDIITRLKDISGKYFSPSALTSYIRNPMDFYHQKILRINEAQDVEEVVAYNTLGTIVHNSLENLYKAQEGKTLSTEVLRKLKQNVIPEVTLQFKENFKEGDFSRGKNLIIFEVAKRYVHNLIDLDLKALAHGHRIEILTLEADLKTQIPIPELDFPVFLGGKIDRIDRYDGQLRIIDYKTGKVNQGDVELVHWDDLTLDYKYNKAFQVLAYALLIHKEQGTPSMEAGIISFKNLQNGFLKFATKETPHSRKKNTLIDPQVLQEFQLQLKKLILEICDPSLPFVEKETDFSCILG
ncbi:MAG: PD-(D/E)XK nuclease family protein [Bacteroidota bacterium]